MTAEKIDQYTIGAGWREYIALRDPKQEQEVRYNTIKNTTEYLRKQRGGDIVR